jgi:2-dehydro-3-deoxyphosphogluconate aldolase / (4S)-4-hydroxy-2-oxoglutarate aldolase
MLEAQLRNARVIPVVTLDRADDAVPLARALCDAGLTLIEVTLRSSAALDAIRAIRAANVGIAVAAGTIRTPRDLHAAAAAGASVFVSPGSTPALIEAARAARLPWLPGASTASEIMALVDAGYFVQKLFPANPPTGFGLIDAFSGPFADVRLVPTGGVDAANMRDFLARPNVLAVAGSWIAPGQLIAAHAWPEIQRRAVAAVAAAQLATRN